MQTFFPNVYRPSGVLGCVFGDRAQLDCIHLTVEGSSVNEEWGWISPKDAQVVSPVRLSGQGILSSGHVAAASSNSKETNWLLSNCERSTSNSSSIVSIKPSFIYIHTEIVLHRNCVAKHYRSKRALIDQRLPMLVHSNEL